ncbi:cell division protein ZapA [Aquidulcibacter sp.]|uniref:cell division protein ZapA n=1 Tax=Aquidulcibacter sp. TaxID=2052990 RepID=UPI0039185279
MAKVQIEINGRRYAIGCDEGQEDHVMRLARYFDDHVKRLASSVGQIGDQRLFLMGALIVADEMHDLKVRLDKAEAEIARLSDVRAQAAQAAIDPAPVTALDGAAGRLEALAARLEQA